MSMCLRAMLVLVLFIALFSLIAPFQLLNFIAADGYAIGDKGLAYVSSQPWVDWLACHFCLDCYLNLDLV